MRVHPNSTTPRTTLPKIPNEPPLQGFSATHCRFDVAVYLMCSLRELYVTSFKDFQRGAQQGILGSRHAIHVAHEQLHQPALDSNCCKRLEENWTNECNTTLSPSEVLKSRSPINLSADTPESHVLPLHTASQECLMMKARIYGVRCSCYPDQAFVCLSMGDKHAEFRCVNRTWGASCAIPP